jgi:hypothetical protein
LYLRDNAASVVWGHAVNSLEALNESLGVLQVDFIEVDVRKAGKGDEVIASHDPSEEGLSFLDLLQRVEVNNVYVIRRVGIKVDFKDLASVEPSLLALQQYVKRLQEKGGVAPVWLNADVLQGPNGNPPTIDAHAFISLCLKYCPFATLSLGWTTGRLTGSQLRGSCYRRKCASRSCFLNFAPPPPAYTQQMIDEMLTLCTKYTLAQVTFAVRAVFLPESWPQIRQLLAANPCFSLTVFTSSQDAIDKEWLVKNLPLEKTFLDLPK